LRYHPDNGLRGFIFVTVGIQREGVA